MKNLTRFYQHNRISEDYSNDDVAGKINLKDNNFG